MGKKPFVLFAAWPDGFVVRRVDDKLMCGSVPPAQIQALLTKVQKAGFFAPLLPRGMDGLQYPDGPVFCIAAQARGRRRCLSYHGDKWLNLDEIGPQASPSRQEVKAFVRMWRETVKAIDEVRPLELREYKAERELRYSHAIAYVEP